jgi:hypothetical protein
MIKFRASFPGQLNIDQARQESLNELRKVGREMRKDFQKTTKTWKRRPDFEIKVGLTRRTSEGSVAVTTDNIIYNYVNWGTGQNAGKGPRYPIWAGAYTGKSKAKMLKFPRNFKPKTKYKTLDSFQGGKFGPMVYTPMVMHPGVKPRRFDLAIKDKWEKPFVDRLQQAINRGMRKARYARGGTVS